MLKRGAQCCARQRLERWELTELTVYKHFAHLSYSNDINFFFTLVHCAFPEWFYFSTYLTALRKHECYSAEMTHLYARNFRSMQGTDFHVLVTEVASATKQQNDAFFCVPRVEFAINSYIHVLLSYISTVSIRLSFSYDAWARPWRARVLPAVLPFIHSYASTLCTFVFFESKNSNRKRQISACATR